MLRDAALVAGKDLRIELRSRVGLNQVGPFAIAVLLLFGLALGPDRAGARARLGRALLGRRLVVNTARRAAQLCNRVR